MQNTPVALLMEIVRSLTRNTTLVKKKLAKIEMESVFWFRAFVTIKVIVTRSISLALCKCTKTE